MTERNHLDARYGRRTLSRRGRILAWVVPMSALGIVLLAWVVWANPFFVGASIEAKDLGSTVVDDGLTSVSFQLTAEPGRTSACAVQALDDAFTIVGWRVVEYPASQEFVRTFTEEVRTAKTATSGLVASCWLT